MYRNKFVASIAVAGHTLRELDGQVYLPFGTEYQIYLKNTHSQEVLVDIEVDGKSILEGKRLIMKAYESHTIATHMDGKGKHYNLKFIEKTAQISEHRGDKVEDGLVRVTYQFVKPAPPIDYSKITYGYKVPDEPLFNYKSPSWFSARGTSLGMATNAVSNAPGDLFVGSAKAGGYDTVNTFLSNCSPIGDPGLNVSYSCTMDWSPVPENKAGITTKGDRRDDVSYNEVSFDKPLEAADSIVLKLVGKKDKNIELENGSNRVVIGKTITTPIFNKQDINCPVCNGRNGSANKYCSNCGTCLI